MTRRVRGSLAALCVVSLSLLSCADGRGAKAVPSVEPVASSGNAVANANDVPEAEDACLTDADCGDGVCEGEGCGDAAPGRCAPRMRACTKDLATYCGCDGRTFRGSGSCPGQRYAHRGMCQEAPSGEEP